MGELRFRFADEEESCDYVSRLAADMPMYAPEHVLSGGYIYQQWRPELVPSRFSVLTRASEAAARRL